MTQKEINRKFNKFGLKFERNKNCNHNIKDPFGKIFAVYEGPLAKLDHDDVDELVNKYLEEYFDDDPNFVHYLRATSCKPIYAFYLYKGVYCGD